MLRLEHHDSPSVLLNVPIRLRIWGGRISHKLNFTRLAVEYNSVGFPNFFSRLIEERHQCYAKYMPPLTSRTWPVM